MKKPHVHAEKMAQYAEDAAETDEPWERWEAKRGDGTWCAMTRSPIWVETQEYRRKPRTININGHEVPEPLREVSTNLRKVYMTCPQAKPGFRLLGTGSPEVIDELLDKGMLHDTAEAAEAHAKALLSFTNGEGRS